MTAQPTHPVAPSGSARDRKAATRAVWALGDYPKVAREVISAFGHRLVEACGIAPGQRVLDVAAGAGNVALAAAETGAQVVASDLTPELLDAGRHEARVRGVELEWREADVEALPFADGEFDVVTSSVGAMFAPDHQRTAAEMLRVCHPGGTIGLINWTPEGSVGRFFATLAPYAPAPPPGAPSPLLWGTDSHVRELLGAGATEIRTAVESLPWGPFPEPRDLAEYYKAHFGPVIATYAHIANDPERTAALDEDFLAYAQHANKSAPGKPAVFELEYLLVVARTKT